MSQFKPYTSKPKKIEAVLITEDNVNDVYVTVKRQAPDAQIVFSPGGSQQIHIPTAHTKDGPFVVSPGEWLIRNDFGWAKSGKAQFEDNYESQDG